jgi:hypothetical protein
MCFRLLCVSSAVQSVTHWTTSFPTYEIADSGFVITVAPQNDICPHDKSYPIKTVAIVKNKITTPTDHVCKKLYDP